MKNKDNPYLKVSAYINTTYFVMLDDEARARSMKRSELIREIIADRYANEILAQDQIQAVNAIIEEQKAKRELAKNNGGFLASLKHLFGG